MLLVPVAHLLEGPAGAHQQVFLEVARDELEAVFRRCRGQVADLDRIKGARADEEGRRALRGPGAQPIRWVNFSSRP